MRIKIENWCTREMEIARECVHMGIAPPRRASVAWFLAFRLGRWSF